MSLIKQVSYIGKGEVMIASRTAATPRMVPLGNVTKLSLSVQLDEKELLDYTSPGGGQLDALTRIQSVTGSLDVTNHSPENIALALRGSTSAIAAGAVTGETHTAYLGSFIKLDRLPDMTQPLTVNVGANTAAEGTDYIRTEAGIWVLQTASGLADGDAVTIDYTAIAQDTIEALVNSGDEYTLLFTGLNEARSGAPVVLTAHRVTFDPTQGLDLIGDDFGALQLGCKLLSDPTVTGAGLSKFIQVQMAQQAV